MKHRKLRIAWSVAWVVVAALLVALWVRSYWWRDSINRNGAGSLSIAVSSDLGNLEIMTSNPVNENLPMSWNYWKYEQGSASKFMPRRPWIPTRFKWQSPGKINRTCIFSAPFWFYVSISGIVAALPWIIFGLRKMIVATRKNGIGISFSLRTLLITTTFIAVGLGLIVWLTR